LENVALMIPLMIKLTPRVAIKGLTFNFVMISPFAKPIIAPIANTAGIAIGTLPVSPCII
jgi:hypothetical protein